MKFKSTRSAQSKIPGMGMLPGVQFSSGIFQLGKPIYMQRMTELHILLCISCMCAEKPTDTVFGFMYLFHHVSCATKPILANHGCAFLARRAFHQFSSGLLVFVIVVFPYWLYEIQLKNPISKWRINH